MTSSGSRSPRHSSRRTRRSPSVRRPRRRSHSSASSSRSRSPKPKRNRRRDASASRSRSRSTSLVRRNVKPQHRCRSRNKSRSPFDKSSTYQKAKVFDMKDNFKSWVRHGENEDRPKRFERSNRVSQADQFVERRREMRCSITARGNAELWGVSPSRKIRHGLDSDVDSDGEAGTQKQWAKYFKKRKSGHKNNDEPAGDSDVIELEISGEKKSNSKKHKKEKKSKKSKKKKKKKKKESSSENEGSSEEEWVEKGTNDSDIEEGLVGPVPKEEDILHNVEDADKNYSLYRLNMLPGEGEAMAQFIADGKRIPRRGEIGMNADSIKTYEDMGFVMSGTRHRRMEATRLRKENQIYSAEEKRMLSTFGHEERQKKETNILSQFKNLVQKKVEQQSNQ